MITLDPTTWEYAAKKKNFSGWVRNKLREEMIIVQNESRERPQYWSYCEKCDLSAYGPNQIQIEYKYCPKCHDKMEFRGIA